MTRGLAFFALALALLLAQGLGLRHQLAHGPHGSHGQAPHAATLADGRHHGSATPGGFDGHDEGSVECRLYDQLAHADGLTGTTTPAVMPSPVDRVASVATRPAPRPAPRHFEARGPPAPA